ncbi:hypothetical protein PanWU01x14_121660 [Parasponia andersonii]|uniref:CLAVATA3/ESR (CLE)-related protein n=1 Tax=Parasponia andersonii TaxID=3476 RepID=A0A2P5CUP9_PARAD|nr:hypothetical protein PanWU01x14_121660 [Parasponia andersonii]
MRVEKLFVLLLGVSIFLSLIQSSSSGSRALLSEDQTEPRFGLKEQHPSMLSRGYSAILDSMAMRIRKVRISPLHAVSHRQVPTGPNPLHN